MANENAVAPKEEQVGVVKINEITDNVIKRVDSLVKEGSLVLPAGYAFQNHIRTAIMVIGDTLDMNKQPAFKVCTPASIQESLFRMVCSGLNPLSSQCYFIVHSNKLTVRRSYMGSIAVAKRVAGVKDVTAAVIYGGDKFGHSIVNGKIVEVKHEQSFENLDNPIVGAYCVVTLPDDSQLIDLMTIKQIKASWSMAVNTEKNKLQNTFGPEAAKRTLISRALKQIINSASDANLYEKDMSEDNEIDEVDHTVVSSSTSSEPTKTKTIALPVAAPKQTVPTTVNREPEPAVAVQEKPKQEQVQQQQSAPVSNDTGEDPASW